MLEELEFRLSQLDALYSNEIDDSNFLIEEGKSIIEKMKECIKDIPPSE